MIIPTLCANRRAHPGGPYGRVVSVSEPYDLFATAENTIMPLGGHSTVSRALHFSTALRFSCSLTFPFSWADRRGGMERCSRFLGMSTRKRMTSEADDNGSSQLKSDNSLSWAPPPEYTPSGGWALRGARAGRLSSRPAHCLVHQTPFSCTNALTNTLSYIRRAFPVQTISILRAEEHRNTMVRRDLCTDGLV